MVNLRYSNYIAQSPTSREGRGAGDGINFCALDFPGGTVDRNPPANAGDMGSIPGPGRFHMPWSNPARAPQPLNLFAAILKPVVLKEE